MTDDAPPLRKIIHVDMDAFYVSVVRPNAAQIIEEQNAAAAADPNYVRERRVAVLIKDLEQEACFILMIWALAIMGMAAGLYVGF